MKLKPHSIRFKFFSAISLVALMFIGILLLLNLFFYQDYFMMTRKSSLCDAFDTVCGSYDGDMDDIVTLLDSYESRSAIRLAVAMDDGTVLTSSFLHDRGDHAAPDFEFGMNEQQFRSIAVLASVMQNEDWSSLAEHQYRFANISLRDNDQYLCLIGSLDKDEGRYLIAYMPFAFIEQNSSLNLVFLLIAGGCALLICLGIAFFFSREFTRPLVSMAALADRMTFPPSTPARAGANPTRSNSSASRSTVSAPISSRPSASSRSPMISLRRRYAKRSASTICAANSSSTFLTS